MTQYSNASDRFSLGCKVGQTHSTQRSLVNPSKVCMIFSEAFCLVFLFKQ